MLLWPRLHAAFTGKQAAVCLSDKAASWPILSGLGLQVTKRSSGARHKSGKPVQLHAQHLLPQIAGSSVQAQSHGWPVPAGIQMLAAWPGLCFGLRLSRLAPTLQHGRYSQQPVPHVMVGRTFVSLGVLVCCWQALSLPCPHNTAHHMTACTQCLELRAQSDVSAASVSRQASPTACSHC